MLKEKIHVFTFLGSFSTKVSQSRRHLSDPIWKYIDEILLLLLI